MAYIQMKTIVVALNSMRDFQAIAVNGGARAEKMMEPPYTLSLLLKMRGLAEEKEGLANDIEGN